MKSKSADPAAAPPASQATPIEAERDQITQNIGAVQEFYRREEHNISRSQRSLERIGLLIGQPLYLGFILLFVALWMLVNVMLHHLGLAAFDPPPFFWLQGSSVWARS